MLSHSPMIVTDGLVLCLDAANRRSYPGSGTSWLDLSGQGNNGTLTNGPTFSSNNGGSIVFDGTNDYIQTSDITLSSANFTLGCWFRFNSLTNNSGYTILTSSHYYAAGYNGNFIFRANYNNFAGYGFSFATYNGQSNEQFQNSSYSFTTNVWYNAVITGNGTNSSVYINTNRILNFAQNKVLTDLSNGGLIIADDISWTNNPLNGNVAITYLYNRTLSADEVRRNYLATKSRFGL